jgi:hypothetical protein
MDCSTFARLVAFRRHGRHPESFEINAQVVSCSPVFILPSFTDISPSRIRLQLKHNSKIKGFERASTISAIDFCTLLQLASTQARFQNE